MKCHAQALSDGHRGLTRRECLERNLFCSVKVETCFLFSNNHAFSTSDSTQTQEHFIWIFFIQQQLGLFGGGGNPKTHTQTLKCKNLFLSRHGQTTCDYVHAQVGGAADLGSVSLWYTLSVLRDQCFKKQQQQKLFIYSLLIHDLSGATS